jgi:hypothetical protein
MMKNGALAADLRILTVALDEPGTDIAQSLRQLTIDAQAAVPSFLGLSMILSRSDPLFTSTYFTDGFVAGNICASLRLMLPGIGDDRTPPTVALILYAGTPGTFIDLAADLAWLTARPLIDFALDQHLTVPAGPNTGTPLAAASIINQAIGVLIGRGRTPEQAHRELDTQTAGTSTDRHAAAHLILATLTTTGSGHADQDVDLR